MHPVTQQETTIPLVNDSALLRYLRHVHGDVGAPKIISEAKKLERRVLMLARRGDRNAVRELVERINNAPAL
jgi:hypothetical protein